MKHSAGTWLSVLDHFPSSDPASLDQVSRWKPDPPACGGGKVGESGNVGSGEPLAQGVTHTHTLTRIPLLTAQSKKM